MVTNIPDQGEVVGLWRGADYGHVLLADGTVKDWDDLIGRSHPQALQNLGVSDFIQINCGFGLTRNGVLKPFNVSGIAELQYSLYNCPIAIKTDGTIYCDNQLPWFYSDDTANFAKSLKE